SLGLLSGLVSYFRVSEFTPRCPVAHPWISYLELLKLSPTRSLYHAWNYTFLGCLGFILYSYIPF
ncbi:hypothetical protein PanWU01x14_334800, partial [Parasponia andersonii]